MCNRTVAQEKIEIFFWYNIVQQHYATEKIGRNQIRFYAGLNWHCVSGCFRFSLNKVIDETKGWHALSVRCMTLQYSAGAVDFTAKQIAMATTVSILIACYLTQQYLNI